MLSILTSVFYLARTLFYIYVPIEKIYSTDPDLPNKLLNDQLESNIIEMYWGAMILVLLAIYKVRKPDLKTITVILLLSPLIMSVLLSILTYFTFNNSNVNFFVIIHINFVIYSFIFPILLFFQLSSYTNSTSLNLLFALTLIVFVIILNLLKENLTLFEIIRSIPYVLTSYVIERKKNLSSK